jgi:hypothetical protein
VKPRIVSDFGVGIDDLSDDDDEDDEGDVFSTRIDLIFETMFVSEFDLGLLPTRFTDILFSRH